MILQDLSLGCALSSTSQGLFSSSGILDRIQATSGQQKSKEELEKMDWRQVLWVGNFYNRSPIGGMDVVSAQDKGTNGSITPQATMLVYQALLEAFSLSAGLQTTPSFIDFGIAEGRAALYWASYSRHRQRHISQAQAIHVFGIEQPHLNDYKNIHSSAELRASEQLNCPVKIHVVWKKCENIVRLQSEFDFLSSTPCVVYSFWTAWLASAKEALLALVGAEPNVHALAVYITSRDKNSIGEPFKEEYIEDILCQHSSDCTWKVFRRIPQCRFIGKGNETATAVIFHRVQTLNHEKESSSNRGIEEPESKQQGFAFLDSDGFVDMCLECGGGCGR